MRGAAPAPPPLGPPLAGAVARRLPLPPQPRSVSQTPAAYCPELTVPAPSPPLPARQKNPLEICVSTVLSPYPHLQPEASGLVPHHTAFVQFPIIFIEYLLSASSSMSSDFPHYNFRMPNIGFQNLPLNIYIVVFGTAIFVFILSLLFCCYLIRLRHQAHKEFYAYKQVILKEKVKELNLHELCAVCLEDFKPRDELGICPCKHAFHRKCLIKWLEVRKVCPLCNMPVLQLAQLHSKQDRGPLQGPLPGAENIV
ncbi:hypothetical protein MJT46_011379 [Ovis ammon polii x Ovis aries]|nr:hypothetical protein MJT46_011379 [Ovis ammon polii x Ovis aries]